MVTLSERSFMLLLIQGGVVFLTNDSALATETWRDASLVLRRGRCQEVGRAQCGVSHHFRSNFNASHLNMWVKSGFCEEGCHMTSDRQSYWPFPLSLGLSGGGSGPIVCSSWTEGANSDAPWLPSMEGTVGGGTRRGGANVSWDTIIHTLNI